MKKFSAKAIAWTLFIVVIGLSVYSIFSTSGQKKKGFSGAERIRKILPSFEAVVKKGMADWQIPGLAIAIVKDDKMVYAKGFGVRSLDGKEPVNEKTIFQIGSTSKAFTAALVAMMVDEGKAKWKDKVIDHVADFQMYDPWVTREFMVEELLEQHSGLPAYSGDFQSLVGFDRKHIKHSLRYIKPATSFRSEFAYVNNLFLVAAEIVERKTGKTWEQNITERIFKPLQMNDSSMDMKSFVESKNAATGYALSDGVLKEVPKNLNWMYIYGPAGGINSNVVDMSKWLILQINDGTFGNQKLVSPENFDYVHSPKTIANANPQKGEFSFYCASWVYEETRPYPMVWHNGGTSGHHTLVAFWPEVKMGMVVLTNNATNTFAEALPKIFNDLYFGNPKRDWSGEALAKLKQSIAAAKAEELKAPASPVAPMALEKYAGTYRNEVYGQVIVEKRDKGLEITMGPDNVKIPLTHWDKDRFSAMVFGDEAKAAVSFDTAVDGTVTEMTIDPLNGDGCGVFQKDKAGAGK